MDFSLNDEQKMMIETVRRFIAEELQPLEDEVENQGFLDKAKAQAIADALIVRLGLNSLSSSFITDACINGDSFIELSFDKSGLIQHLSSKPQLYFFRRTNEADQFVRPDRAFYYSEYG